MFRIRNLLIKDSFIMNKNDNVQIMELLKS